MGNVVVDYQVFMSHCHSVDKAQSIGTDGLATCVGIVALREDGTVFCGHLPCMLTGSPNNKDSIGAKTLALLAEELGPAAAVKEVHYATSNAREPTAKWIIEAASRVYKSAPLFESNSIYWSNGEARPLPGNMALVGRTRGDAGEDGPFVIEG